MYSEERTMKKQKFSGWKVAVGAFILMFTVMGSMSTFPVFMLDILKVNHMEMNILMIIVVFSTISTMLFCIWTGQVLEKLGIKKLLFLVLMLNIIHWLCMAYSSTYWMYFATAFLGGIKIAFSTFVPTAILINRWFVEKRATVIGFIYSGAGFGGTLFLPLAGFLLNKIGDYRLTYVAICIITSLFIPICMLLTKDSPEKYGEKPYGWKKAEDLTDLDAMESSKELPGVTIKQSLKTASFWLCIFAILLVGIVNSARNFVVPYFIISGVDPVVSSSIAGFLTLINGLAIILFGWFADKFGVRWYVIVTGGILSLGMFLISGFGGTIIMAILACIVYGSGSAFSCSVQSLLPSPIFGPKDYQKIVGPFNSAIAFGASAGAVGLATIVGTGDVGEKYKFMFNITGIVAIASVLLLVLAFALRPYKGKQKGM